MAEGSFTTIVRKIVFRVEPYLPQIPKPKKKVSLQKKLLWCGVILLIYMVMGQTPLFGATAPQFDFLAFARVIFASQQGTLVELGIGPIVTAGLLMQLLRGSDILKFDFKKPEERGIFQTATKLVTYVVIVAESIVYDDSSAVVLEHYGDVLIALDDRDEALVFYKKALELDRDSSSLSEKISSYENE